MGKTPAGQAPLDVVAFVGDNILDFPGLTQAIRQGGDAAFSGVRRALLPGAEPDVRQLGTIGSLIQPTNRERATRAANREPATHP